MVHLPRATAHTDYHAESTTVRKRFSPRTLVPAFTESSSHHQPSSSRSEQHLVLVGGGHAHVQVIRALNAQTRPSNLKVTLIDAQPSASYSGMVPGCVAGLYTPEQTQLHLEPLARWAGIRFVQDVVVDLDLERRLVYTQKQKQAQAQTNAISFDAISIDIGSASRNWHTIPGAQQFTIPTRPINKLIERLDRARQELEEEKEEKIMASDNAIPTPDLVVVGGGAAGLELALSVTSRWRKSFPDTTCTLLDAGSQLLPQESSKAARIQLDQVIKDKSIDVHFNCIVQQVLEDRVNVLQNGEVQLSIPFTHCIWAAGAGPNQLARHLASARQNHQQLDMTTDGWIQVNPSLQSTSHPFVFAAGDCASIEGLPTGSAPPKAGVYAVRAGPILIENLTRYLSGRPLIQYEPQDDFLKLIVCGEREALGLRFGIAIRGRWVWQLKDHIDKSFMDLFRVNDSSNEHPPSPQSNEVVNESRYDTSQYDASGDHATTKPLPEPDQAAELLQRQDDDVDYLLAWQTLRAMARDPSYRDAVVALVGEKHDAVKEQTADPTLAASSF